MELIFVIEKNTNEQKEDNTERVIKIFLMQRKARFNLKCFRTFTTKISLFLVYN